MGSADENSKKKKSQMSFRGPTGVKVVRLYHAHPSRVSVVIVANAIAAAVDAHFFVLDAAAVIIDTPLIGLPVVRLVLVRFIGINAGGR